MHTSLVWSSPGVHILGPLLFLIYVNDLASLTVSERSQLVLYADDLVLYKPISTSHDYCDVRNDMATIEAWSLRNSLTFNAAKCKHMVISNRKIPTAPPSPLLLNGTPVERVECFRYLGLLLASDLSWSQHIDSICSKTKKILGLLYRCYYNYADSDVLKQLYIYLVRPHLEYGCVIWDPYTTKGKKSMEKVQHFACKLATKCWDASYEALGYWSCQHLRKGKFI